MLVAGCAVLLGVLFHRPPITRENVHELEVIGRIARDVWEIDWSRDGGRVAMLGWERPAEIFEAKTLIHYRTLVADKKPIHFAFSPDENVFAYCENTTKVEIYHADTRETMVIETGNQQPEMSFSPDGKILGTGGYGTRAHLWDAATGKLRQSLYVGPKAGGLSVVFSPDGALAAVSHRNHQARLFDVASGKQLQVLAGRMTHDMAFDPSGERVAVAYVDGTVALFDAASGKQLFSKVSGAKEVYTVEWSPAGDLLLSAGRQGDIVVWSASDLSVRCRLAAPEWVIGVKFTPDGTRLLTAGGSSAAGSRDRVVQIWAIPPWWRRLFRFR